MFIITAKYRLSINERSKNRRDYPYATTRTRTYTEERVFGLSGGWVSDFGRGGAGAGGGGDARIDKARTDRDVCGHHISKHRSTKARDIRIFDKKENKSVGVNRSRSDNERFTHCLIYENQSIYVYIYIIGYTHIHIYAYTYILIRVSLSTHMQGSSLHVRMYRYICYG